MKRFSEAILVLGIAAVLVWAFWPKTVRTPAVNAQTGPVAMIVPHHNVVAAQRLQAIQKLGQLVTPPTIILISPNHFDAGVGQAITRKGDWQLAGGPYSADAKRIETLVAAGVVTDEEDAFIREHGITNVLPDLQTVWPQAQVIPIMLRPTISKEAVKVLEAALEKSCTDCLVVASVDFSHYQPAALADLHDEMTLRYLKQADETNIWRAEVDSPAALALTVQWAKSHQTTHFDIEAHTNSGTLVGNPEIETTTHVMGWYDAQATDEALPNRTFVIGGDLMLGRDIAQLYQKKSFADLWTKMGERTFWGVDLPMVNLETPIADSATVPALEPNNLHFISPKTTASFLAKQHIGYAALANNHSGTFGADRLTATRTILTDAGVTPVGDPNTTKEYLLPAGAGEIPIGVVPVNMLSDDGAQVPAAIQRLKSQDAFVIVFPHWGNEYQPTHNATQEALAKAWVKAGADLIIGSHPHVRQDAAIIDGKPVIYSIGNLVFDQYFSKETQQGLIIGGEISPHQLKLVILPTKMTKGQPELQRGADRTAALTAFQTDFGLSSIEGDKSRGVFLFQR